MVFRNQHSAAREPRCGLRPRSRASVATGYGNCLSPHWQRAKTSTRLATQRRTGILRGRIAKARVLPSEAVAAMLKFLSPEAQAALLKLVDERVAERVTEAIREEGRPRSPWLTIPEAAEYLR